MIKDIGKKKKKHSALDFAQTFRFCEISDSFTSLRQKTTIQIKPTERTQVENVTKLQVQPKRNYFLQTLVIS